MLCVLSQTRKGAVVSDYPTMEITIKLLFTACGSGVQYQVTSSCYTKVNNGEEIKGKSGPLRDFMHTDDVKSCAKSNIDIWIRGNMHHVYCCDVSNGLRIFNTVLRRVMRGEQ